MSAGANGKVIVAATRELARKWERTREHWRDAKALEFEQKYLNELFSSVERAALVLDEIERVISNARKKCE